jgi:DNA-binding MarR family transcriptional regulator
MKDIQQYVLQQPSEVGAFFELVDAAARVIGVSEKYWHSLGLNGARIRVLVEIAKAGGSILPSALAQRIGVTRANISVLLVPLEDRGYIHTSSHPEDGRRRRVVLTEEGKQLLLDVLPGNREVITAQMKRLSPEELELLSRLLAKLQEGAE